MKYFLVTAMILSSSVRAEESVLTDEMAMEDGMTPISRMATGMNAFDLSDIMTTDRSEYVSTIPSEEDIARVISTHTQVIVVNKAASGPDSQTLRVYRNGVIKPLKELTMVEEIIDGKKVRKEVLLEKDYVKISTGREKTEVAASGRKYFSTTPKGFFKPQRVYKMYYSGTWKADMPNAMFINCSRNDFNAECGIALHATTASHYARLGKRDSGGCVRTRLEVSKQLRELVMETGLGADNYTIKTESYRRDKVMNNSIVTDLVNRDSGNIVNKKIKSWDTVFVIYE